MSQQFYDCLIDIIDKTLPEMQRLSDPNNDVEKKSKELLLKIDTIKNVSKFINNILRIFLTTLHFTLPILFIRFKYHLFDPG